MKKNDFTQSVKDTREIIRTLKKKSYYQDILGLLLLFLLQVEEGLSQKHFRFLLMDNHGLKDTRKMVEFCTQYKFLFKSFPDLEKNEVITAKNLAPHLKYLRKNNIKNEDDLDKYLKHLLKHYIIKPTNRKKPFRYKLSPEAIWGYHLLRVEDYLEKWEPGLLRLPIESRGEGYFEDLYLYALPINIKFTTKEFEEIDRCINEVRKILRRILELKKNKLHRLYNNRTSQKELPLFIDFFYHGESI